ncbi:MAG: hypothetical protein QG551_162 [Patescibacteria group bacterium]|jgi:hypothetical protein|nr:hypothetical protein [Patescibacteria group bacterium]
MNPTKVYPLELTETVVSLIFLAEEIPVVAERISKLNDSGFCAKHGISISVLPKNPKTAKKIRRVYRVSGNAPREMVRLVELKTLEGRKGMWNGPIEHTILHIRGEKDISGI